MTILNNLLLKEYGKYKIKPVDILFLVIMSVIGIYMRSIFMTYESNDWKEFLMDWCSQLSNEGIKALGHPIGNYTCVYMYLLLLIVKLPIPWLYGIKIASIIFDYVGATVVGLIILRLTNSKSKAIIGFMCIICSPTVILNGAAWGQCDIIYATFVLLSFGAIAKKKEMQSMIWYAVAFSIKLQAIFFLPVLVILWLKGRVKTWHFTYIPLIYFATILPSWIMGRNLSSLLTIYIEQTETYQGLSLLYPNFYYLLGDTEYNGILAKFGICLTIVLLGGIAYWLYTKDIKISNEILLKLSLFICMLTVYFLPHMHERYGFLAGIFCIIYGIYDVKKIYIPILWEIITGLCYLNYLFSMWSISIYILLAIMGILLLVVGFDLYYTVLRETNNIGKKDYV